MDCEDGHKAPGARNIAEGFLYTLEQNDPNIQLTNGRLVTMIADIDASLSCIDETPVPNIKRFMACIQALSEPHQLIAIGGHTLKGGEMRKLWVVLMISWERLNGSESLVPKLKKHIFSVLTGLADGVEVFFSRNN